MNESDKVEVEEEELKRREALRLRAAMRDYDRVRMKVSKLIKSEKWSELTGHQRKYWLKEVKAAGEAATGKRMNTGDGISDYSFWCSYYKKAALRQSECDKIGMNERDKELLRVRNDNNNKSS